MFDNIEPLIDRWIDDNGFRAALQRDPEAALRAAGVTLTTTSKRRCARSTGVNRTTS
jgi:hypothetical protein